VLFRSGQARASLEQIQWRDAGAEAFFQFMFDEMLVYTEASALCQCFWLAASRWLYAEAPEAREAALRFDRRLARLSTRAGAVLDAQHAGRHWEQYGLQHFDAHGFRAWCRSYWYALQDKPGFH